MYIIRSFIFWQLYSISKLLYERYDDKLTQSSIFGALELSKNFEFDIVFTNKFDSGITIKKKNAKIFVYQSEFNPTEGSALFFEFLSS